MGRLIDADALKKKLSEMEDEYRANLCENCNDDTFSDGVLSALFSVFQVISSQPTAYDVEKVVEELQSLSNAEADYYYANSNDVIDRETAIDIVKNGGSING